MEIVNGDKGYKPPKDRHWDDLDFCEKRVIEQETYLRELSGRELRQEITQFRAFQLRVSAQFQLQQFLTRSLELRAGKWLENPELKLKWQRGEKLYPEAFILWYSGMATNKVRKAYQRFLKETNPKSNDDSNRPNSQGETGTNS